MKAALPMRVIMLTIPLLTGPISGTALAADQAAFNNAELKRLADSRETWNSKKQQSGGVYSYRSRFQSWTGFHSTTTQYVANDAVYRRIYEAYDPAATDEHGQTLRGAVYAYDERRPMLGTSRQGAKVSTVDGLYDDCAAILTTRDPAQHRITFELSGDRLLRSCQYAPKDCADDCAEGVQIRDIDFAE